MEKIQFMPEEGGPKEEFFVLEEARLAGRNYLLVTDSEEGDGEALILREQTAASADEDGAGQGETSYEIVEDDTELSAVLLLMRDTLEELGIEVEE